MPALPRARKPRLAQAHEDRVCEEIRALRQSRTPLALRGAGHEDREDLLLVLAAEGLRVEREQASVAALQSSRIRHVVAIPPLVSSRDIATRAFACKRAASSASRSPPEGV